MESRLSGVLTQTDTLYGWTSASYRRTTLSSHSMKQWGWEIYKPSASLHTVLSNTLYCLSCRRFYLRRKINNLIRSWFVMKCTCVIVVVVLCIIRFPKSDHSLTKFPWWGFASSLLLIDYWNVIFSPNKNLFWNKWKVTTLQITSNKPFKNRRESVLHKLTNKIHKGREPVEEREGEKNTLFLWLVSHVLKR